MLDADGKELWQTDLNKAAKPGDKPWTKNQKAEQLAPGVWRTNGGLAHSDLGSQIVIEAPRGLILIDPNAGASFEQNWARIQGAGLDPMQLKYVLLTHEHGDHAPGAYLWRVVTGAQVVASAEMAYILQHHIPGGTGYGFHPSVPADIVLTEDKELDLAGLKVKAMRLPGHTSGSMGYAFENEGRTYVATGDLIMPGGVLGYSGSLDFSAQDVLASLRKLAALRPDEVLGGHGGGDPDHFIAAGIEAGQSTGWSRMTPEKPNPLYRFAQTNYLVAAWLEPVVSAAYGDVDGDGRPDVAVLVPKGRGSAVKVYFNKGAGDGGWGAGKEGSGFRVRGSEAFGQRPGRGDRTSRPEPPLEAPHDPPRQGQCADFRSLEDFGSLPVAPRQGQGDGLLRIEREPGRAAGFAAGTAQVRCRAASGDAGVASRRRRFPRRR